MTALVYVGWTSTRPVVPDEHLSVVTVAGDDPVECTLIAAQMVACRPECQMVTSTRLIAVAAA